MLMFAELGSKLFLLIGKGWILQDAKEYKWKYVKKDVACGRIIIGRK